MELVQEKQTSAALSSALQACTEEKAQLQEEKEALINVRITLQVFMHMSFRYALHQMHVNLTCRS